MGLQNHLLKSELLDVTQCLLNRLGRPSKYCKRTKLNFCNGYRKNFTEKDVRAFTKILRYSSLEPMANQSMINSYRNQLFLNNEFNLMANSSSFLSKLSMIVNTYRKMIFNREEEENIIKNIDAIKRRIEQKLSNIKKSIEHTIEALNAQSKGNEMMQKSKQSPSSYKNADKPSNQKPRRGVRSSTADITVPSFLLYQLHTNCLFSKRYLSIESILNPFSNKTLSLSKNISIRWASDDKSKEYWNKNSQGKSVSKSSIEINQSNDDNLYPADPNAITAEEFQKQRRSIRKKNKTYRYHETPDTNAKENSTIAGFTMVDKTHQNMSDDFQTQYPLKSNNQSPSGSETKYSTVASSKHDESDFNNTMKPAKDKWQHYSPETFNDVKDMFKAGINRLKKYRNKRYNKDPLDSTWVSFKEFIEHPLTFEKNAGFINVLVVLAVLLYIIVLPIRSVDEVSYTQKSIENNEKDK